jgi:hypothetical protein
MQLTIPASVITIALLLAGQPGALTKVPALYTSGVSETQPGGDYICISAPCSQSDYVGGTIEPDPAGRAAKSGKSLCLATIQSKIPVAFRNERNQSPDTRSGVPDLTPVSRLDYDSKLIIGHENTPFGREPTEVARAGLTDSLYPLVSIAKVENALHGHIVEAVISIENETTEIGGFDFLIGYDASILDALAVRAGQLIEDCRWEYFTYRIGAQADCGDACPSGLIRIVAIADTDNGPYHPLCYGPPDTETYALARLKFLVTVDRNVECQFIPVFFFWTDCGDNALSSKDGNQLIIDRAIYDYDDSLIWDEEDDSQFPEEDRIPFVGAPDSCLNTDPDKPTPVRHVNFKNGGVDIICVDSIDARGDVNLDGIPFEIADATVFTNYFIYGLRAFTINIEGQIAATDVNIDGVPLTVADLTFMIRVISGDTVLTSKPIAPDQQASLALEVVPSRASVRISSRVDIGALWLVIKHSGYKLGTPRMGNCAPDMSIRTCDEDGTLKILIYSLEEGRRIPAGSGNILFIPLDGEGKLDVAEVQLSDYFGRTLACTRETEQGLPDDYILRQNYPNPFNTATEIIYRIPEAAHVRLDIVNISGQRIITLVDGEQAEGFYRIIWNGLDQSGGRVASGVYFYRLEADGYHQTRKMTLLK